ncbi:MAG: hypothetical protein LBI96_05500 [Odoribacteraceae bacterium]|jgi:hypothetical protein|nr:hypothetical protein [Odoribacteraceae bacterium]
MKYALIIKSLPCDPSGILISPCSVRVILLTTSVTPSAAAYFFTEAAKSPVVNGMEKVGELPNTG